MCISKWITCLSVCKESTCGLEISHQERLYLSVCPLLARMGREFVVMDPMEDQTSSCTCSEASPFNCTCPRVDSSLLPTQSMPPELIRPVSRTTWPPSQLRPVARRSIAPRAMRYRPIRGRPRIPYTGNSGPPLLPTPLNFAPNHNLGARESEDIVRASEPQISNIEASERIPVESISPGLRPIARYIEDRIGGFVQTPDGRIMIPYIGISGPPLLNLALNHNPGVRESENIVRASESVISNIESSQRVPVESISPGFRPVALYIGDRIGGIVETPDGRLLIVSEEFWRWADGRTRLEVQNAVLEDYGMLESMDLLSISS